ncbi:MAG: TonB-dependent receptor [Ferruginibacter sp.]
MKFSYILLIFLLSEQVQAQVKITGKVTDNRNKPLYGVSISIKDSYEGAITDSLGNFQFQTTETGLRVLEATLVGYSSYAKNISIDKGLDISIQLKELITELNAVTITAGSFEAGDKKKAAVLTALDIVTTASAEGDITGALKSLPGTQQVGEAGGLFVRGGSAVESKIYIDGNLVNNFFYSNLPGMASRGRFNPFLFKGTIFSTGGYSALYGQALSSALILESNDLPQRTEASLGISVIGLNAGIQKLAKNKRSSWGASYAFSHLGPAFAVIKQKQDYFKNPVFNEGDANFRIKTKRGMIKYFGYWSQGNVGFRSQDIDSAVLKNAFSLRNFNTYQNLTWKETVGRGWKLQAGLSIGTDRQDIKNELQNAAAQKQLIINPFGYAVKNYDLITKSMDAQARLVIEKRLGGINTVRFGSDYFYNNEQSTYAAYNGVKSSQTIREKIYAGFAETDFYLSPDLAVKLGARAEHSALARKWNLAPRASLAYKFKDKSQASLAYGMFYQNAETNLQPAVANIGFAKAAHYILQYQKMANQRTFRAELFYKDYEKLYKTAAIQTIPVAVNANGNGYAKGFEIFYRDKKTIKDMDYWVSYSFLDTKRDYLNFPGAMEPNFAAKHTASLIVKKFMLPWKTGFNMSYNYASGRPYYHIGYDYAQNKNVLTDKGRTIDYNNVSFGLNYLPKIGKKDAKSFIVYVLSVSNAFGIKQVFTYNYGTVNTGNKEAVGPTSKRFVFIGCFISFGTDRTDDAINNNL